MRVYRISRWLVALSVASCVGLASPAPRAQGTDPATTANGAKLAQLLPQTGYTYKTHNNTTWSIEVPRKNIGNVRVIISVGSDIVVTFAILAKKAALQKTVAFYESLATANHDYDYAKIGLDKDGDLFVRIDTSARLIDAKELKSVIDQVANASNEVYAKVSGSIRR